MKPLNTCLTLTLVVFECGQQIIYVLANFCLTLTLVVFELNNLIITIVNKLSLTLTLVVFELICFEWQYSYITV